MVIVNRRELTIILKDEEIDKFRDLLSCGVNRLCDRNLSASYEDVLFFIGDLATRSQIELYVPEVD